MQGNLGDFIRGWRTKQSRLRLLLVALHLLDHGARVVRDGLLVEHFRRVEVAAVQIEKAQRFVTDGALGTTNERQEELVEAHAFLLRHALESFENPTDDVRLVPFLPEALHDLGDPLLPGQQRGLPHAPRRGRDAHSEGMRGVGLGDGTHEERPQRAYHRLIDVRAVDKDFPHRRAETTTIPLVVVALVLKEVHQSGNDERNDIPASDTFVTLCGCVLRPLENLEVQLHIPDEVSQHFVLRPELVKVQVVIFDGLGEIHVVEPDAGLLLQVSSPQVLPRFAHALDEFARVVLALQVVYEAVTRLHGGIALQERCPASFDGAESQVDEGMPFGFVDRCRVLRLAEEVVPEPEDGSCRQVERKEPHEGAIEHGRQMKAQATEVHPNVALPSGDALLKAVHVLHGTRTIVQRIMRLLRTFSPRASGRRPEVLPEQLVRRARDQRVKQPKDVGLLVYL
mmetsp:Transcript_53409/g.148518  ORF Transcript_53409/g.148518 Transcript_53409/m.148518 type:complete len:454 (+) Transcript_53409:1556-2917(+)